MLSHSTLFGSCQPFRELLNATSTGGFENRLVLKREVTDLALLLGPGTPLSVSYPFPSDGPLVMSRLLRTSSLLCPRWTCQTKVFHLWEQSCPSCTLRTSSSTPSCPRYWVKSSTETLSLPEPSPTRFVKSVASNSRYAAVSFSSLHSSHEGLCHSTPSASLRKPQISTFWMELSSSRAEAPQTLMTGPLPSRTSARENTAMKTSTSLPTQARSRTSLNFCPVIKRRHDSYLLSSLSSCPLLLPC